MLAGKMKEIKKSVRRVYMRLLVLGAVVVFGAIAIAQAQKAISGSDDSNVPDPMEVGSKLSPIAKANTNEADVDGSILPTNAEFPEDDTDQWQDDIEETDDASAWPTEDLTGDQSFDQELPPAMLDEPDVSADVALSEDASSDISYRDEIDSDYALPDDAVADLSYDDEVAYEQTSEISYAESDEQLGAQESDWSDDLPPTGTYEADETYLSDYDEVDQADLPDQQPTEQEEQPIGQDAVGDQQLREPPLIDNAADAIQSGASQAFQAAGAARALQAAGAPQAAESAISGNDTAQQDLVPPDRPQESSPSIFDPAVDNPVAQTDIARRSASLAIGKPGPRHLEGPQTPTLTLEKRVPAEIRVGQPTTFEIHVRNAGRVAADNVVIRDQIPAGTQLVDSSPKAVRDTDGSVYWQVGTVSPGEDVSVQVELMPVEEGQLGSVATVTFEASATARVRATKPDLVVEHTGPRQVLAGNAVRFSIKVSNPGSGSATQVVLQEDVPVGLSHSSGNKLEYEVGTIQPGQTRHLELTLKAAQPGQVTNVLTVRGAGGLVATDTVELEVVAPKLQVEIAGPARRFLNRQATFGVKVANPGTAPASEVEVVAQLPRGLTFVSTNNSGYYDQSRHAVVWSLETLPAGEMGEAQFTAKPTEMGQYQIKASGKANAGLEADDEHGLHVDGIAALFFGLADQVDPIESGGRTVYEIKVVNQGTKAASNVRLAALIPKGLKPVSAEGPVQEKIDGQRIIFQAMDRLAAGGDAVFRITCQAQEPGDHRFRVQLTSDDMSTPVIKEESTRVYSD